ncbi:MAG: biosynthetic-type acetolactate synthase large subunit [Coriobacteriaceae bacterium]|nr:biosynthetic-type acetolactate synthase large subunit [Coriobacteriaceae bacterium]
MSSNSGKKMSGGQCLISALEDTGVEVIFGYPGGQAIDIYNALYDSKKLRHVLVRHEQGATHAADGYARATGKVGTVIVTSGPGACNTVTGVATAYMDSIPIVVITGQVPTNALGSDAFQESDITGITTPIVKHSYLIHDARDIAPTIAEAYHIASTGRPGPVLVDIPSNLVKEQDVPYNYPDEVRLKSYKPTVKGHSKQIKQAASAIKHAKRPVLYVGGGALASHACKDVLELAETMQIPTVVSLIGKGVFPEDNPLCLGMAGMHGTKAANYALSGSDLIIAVGTRFADRVTGKISEFAPLAKVIHIDIDPAEISKNRNADIPIVGDAKTVVSALNEELHKSEPQVQTADWIAQIDTWRAANPLYYEQRDDVILPEYALERLNALTKDVDTIYTTEVGQHQMFASQYLKTTRSRTFISSGGAGTMGFGLPAAMGAQLGKPDSRVVCVAGDGSIQMNAQEMATIRENDLPIKLMILNNSCLGMVHQWQELFYDKRYSNTIFSSNPDFVKLADAYGWQGERVSKPEDLDAAIKRWLDFDGPALLEVKIPASENVYPMVAPGAALIDMLGVATVDKDGNAVIDMKEGE